jgi:hypothetical protein
MTIAYKYKIENAMAYSKSTMTNIIKQVRFVIEATDGNIVMQSFFPVELDEPSEQNFVEYEKLTAEQIMQWVKSKIDPMQIAALEEGLAGRLQQKAQSQEIQMVAVALPN